MTTGGFLALAASAKRSFPKLKYMREAGLRSKEKTERNGCQDRGEQSLPRAINPRDQVRAAARRHRQLVSPKASIPPTSKMPGDCSSI